MEFIWCDQCDEKIKKLVNGEIVTMRCKCISQNSDNNSANSNEPKTNINKSLVQMIINKIVS
jgi:hypothetical protein